MKKLISTALASAVLLSNFAFLSANAAFTDLEGYYEEAVEALCDQGALDCDGLFNGGQEATRGFAISLLMSGYTLGDVNKDFPFTDVPTSHKYYNDILAAYEYGFISGATDSKGNLLGTFRPDDPINRAELMKIITLATDIEVAGSCSLTVFPDVNASDWFCAYVEAGFWNSIVNGFGDGTFGPARNVYRQDAAVMAYRAQSPQQRDEDDLPVTNSSNSGGAVTGDSSLEVSYSNAVSELSKIDFKNKRHGDNYYTGNLPAPEGTVVNGLVGMNVTVVATGNGKYQFEQGIWWEEPLACRDENRTLIGSTGLNYENAWFDGFEDGMAQYEANPLIFNDSAASSYGSNSAAYSDGYLWGWEGNQSAIAKSYICSHTSSEVNDSDYVSDELSQYDNDGWKMASGSELDDLGFEYAYPVGSAPVYSPNNPYNGLGSEAYSIDIAGNVEALESELNFGNDVGSLDTIYFFEQAVDGGLDDFDASTDDTSAYLAEFASYLGDGIVVADADPTASCFIYDSNNPYWEGQLDSSFEGFGYFVEEVEVAGVHGARLTTRSFCAINEGSETNYYLYLSENYYFLTEDENLIMMNVVVENKTAVGSDGWSTVEGSDFYDRELLEQFFSKFEGVL